MDGRSPKLTNKVSPHIQSQLPEFVQSDHPQFAIFLKHYFQFMESGQLVLGGSNDYVIQETNSVNYIVDEVNEEKVVLEESVGKFQAGETIRGENSGFTAVILVDDYDSNKVLYISSQQKFEDGENVIGQTSGAKAPVVSYRANPIQNIQQLLAYADTDNTVYSFLDKFQHALMESIPESLADGISKRNLIKNIRDLYETKGSEEGHKLFFRILFDEESSLIYPRENVLRVSNGQWSDDYLMRVTEIGTSDYSTIVGQVVTGETSQASAVVQTVIKYKEGAQLVAELNLDRTTITGEFIIGETVNAVSNELDQLIRAQVSGIVDKVTITESGGYYKVGDTVHFELLGSVGIQGSVNAIGAGGIDEIHIEDGGTGYTYDDVVTFNNSNTNGGAASARITVLGGSFVLEDETEIDNIVLEGEPNQNIILEHVDHILYEDGDNIIAEDSLDNFRFLREESEKYSLQQEQQLTETDTLLLETGDEIVLETQTFTDLGVPSEASEITKVDIVNTGDGYTTLPVLGVTSSTGNSASILAKSVSGVGRVLSINVTNLGLGYTSVPSITMNRNIIIKDITGTFTIGDTFTSHTASVVSYNPLNRLLELETPVEHFTTGDIITTSTGASATVVQCVHSKATTGITAIANTGGNYITERGHISESSMKVQDSFYYQDYSYVVRIGESINRWRDSIRRSVHPAGWSVFGEVSFATSLADAQLNSLRIRNPAAGDVIDFTGDTQTFTPELASTLRTLFTEVFGRRLGTKTDGTDLRAEEGALLLEDGNEILLDGTDALGTDAGDNIIFRRDITMEGQEDAPLSSGTREVTLTSAVTMTMNLGGNPQTILGPTLDLLPKYAFAVPPIETSEAIQHYPGIYRTAINNVNDGAYFNIEQFGHYRIDQVSVRSDVTGREDFSSTSVSFDQLDRFDEETNSSFDETNIIIPLEAYRTKINVPPPSEIILYRGHLYQTFDMDFTKFDDGVTRFDEAEFGIGDFDSTTTTFDSSASTFDVGDNQIDTEGRHSVSFDEVNNTDFSDDTVSFDAASGNEQDYEVKTFDESDDTFDVSTNTFDASNTIGRISLFSTQQQTFDNSTETYDSQ